MAHEVEADAPAFGGGFHLLQFALNEHNLIHRHAVGGGKRLFADESPPRGFAVRSTRTTASGAVHLVLAPEPFRTGEYAVEDGQEVTRLE